MLGIVSAFKEEVGDYLSAGRFRPDGRDGALRYYRSAVEPDVVVLEGAVGRERASEATSSMIERFEPHLIVSAGFAAGAQEGLNPGDLFLCDTLMSIDGPAALWPTKTPETKSLSGMAMADSLVHDLNGAHSYTVGACLSVPELMSGRSMKGWIGDTFPVSVIDMESYWVSEVASSHHLPHLVVRCVLDPVGQTLPPLVGALVSDVRGPRWFKAMKHVIANPTEIPALIALARQTRVARASLCTFLGALTSRTAVAGSKP